MTVSDNTPALPSGNRGPAHASSRGLRGRHTLPQDAWWRSPIKARSGLRRQFIARANILLERKSGSWRIIGLSTEYVPFADQCDIWEMDLRRSAKWAMIAESMIRQDFRGRIPDIMKARDLGDDRFEVEIHEVTRVWHWA